MSELNDRKKIEAAIESGSFLHHADELISAITRLNDQEDTDLLLCKLAIAFAQQGEFEKGHNLLSKVILPYEKVEGLIQIADLLLSAGRNRDSLILLQEAEKFADDLESFWQKGELLDRLARVYLKADKRGEAIRVLESAIRSAQTGEKSTSLQDSLDSSSVLGDLSMTLTQIGLKEKAVEVAGAIKSEWIRNRTFVNLSNASTEKDNIHERS